MKYLILIITLLISISAIAQNQVPDAQKGSEYGAGVSEDITFDVYSTARLIKALDKNPELDSLIIQAKVTDVCPRKGCWMKLETPDKTAVFVKMKDYAFFVPMNMIGKTVLLDAKAGKKTISIKELKHYAEDAKKSQAEIDAITEPKTEIRILANGIKVID